MSPLFRQPQEVSIQDNQVTLGAGFQCPASVPILFEETFYNEKEQAYSILCIARPLEAQSPGMPIRVPQPQACDNQMKEIFNLLFFLCWH